jgi:membrane AbrB-like protein
MTENRPATSRTSVMIAATGRLALTLAIGTAGGSLFAALGLPAPWLSGAGTAAAIAALLGVGLVIPAWLRQSTLVFLGIVAGSAVTPETLLQMTHWPISLLGLAVCVALIMVSIATYLERVHGFDPATARLSAVPGALPFVLALAVESNGDQRRIAIVQILRLVVLLVVAPILLSLAGPPPPSSKAVVKLAEASLLGIAELAFAGAIGGWIFARLKAPAPYLFGSMVAAALATGSGSLDPTLPAWLMLPGFVITGTMVGSGFAGTDLKLLRKTTVAGLGSVAIGASVGMICAIPVAMVLDMPPAQVWLAYAPGGIETMSILALALGHDAAYVGAHHAARFMALGIVVPFWLRNFMSRDGAKASE